MIQRIEKTGDIVKIPFDNGFFTYAQVLTDSLFAFYDSKTTYELQNICDVLNRPKLFTISVHASAVRAGSWKVVGKCELPEDSKTPHLFYKNKIMPIGHPPQYEIYQDGVMRDAMKKECIGLEYLFVWTRDKVEERLRDHYAGRQNFQANYYRIS